MVAIFTGLGAGAERGSGNVLGRSGLLGGASLGRSAEQVLLNAATGNLMIQQKDEMLVGMGLDASVARTYNSLGDLSDENGDNWRQSTDRRVYGLTGSQNALNSTIKRVSADGSEITYTWDTTKNAYVGKDGSGAYDTLTWNAGTAAWTWTDGDSQVTETYGQVSGSQWLITRQTDTSGNALTFSYVGTTSHLDKVTITDTIGGGTQYLQYSWSGNNITQITTSYKDLVSNTAKTLTRTRYTYDGSNRLSTVTVDLTPGDNSVADGKTYTTTYSYVGATKMVSTITETDGSSLTIGYDGSNRVHTLTQAVATGVSRVTTIDYYTGYSTVTDAAGQVTRLDYDANDNLTTITAPPASTGLAAQVTKFTYDAIGNLTSVVDPLGGTTTYATFVNGKATIITDPLGNVTTRTYGSKNELLTERVTGDDQSGSGRQHTTRYVYDTYDRLAFEISADGNVVEHRYVQAGESFTLTYVGPIYDVSGLGQDVAPTFTQMNDWVLHLSAADQSAVDQSYTTYDARGNIKTVVGYAASTSPGTPSTANGYSLTTYTYDQAGQLLSRQDYSRTAETFVYDGLGRVLASVDIQGGTTNVLFDDANAKTIVTLANGLTQTSTYDKAGELIASTRLAASTVSPNLKPDLSNNNQWGRTGLAAPTGTGPYTFTATAAGAYLWAGNFTVATGDTLTWEVTVRGAGSTLTDALGFNAGTGGWGDSTNVTATILSGPGTISAPNGNPLTVSGLQTNADTRIRITRTFTTATTASAFFYLKGVGSAAINDAVILSASNIVKTSPNPQAVAASTTYDYDQLGRVRVVTDATNHKSYMEYDAVGRKIADIDQAGNVVEYKYDADNRVIATVRYATALNSTQLSALQSAPTTFDFVSNRPADSASSLWTFNFYDKAGRTIETIDGAGEATAYSYDTSGKLTGTTAYANKLTATQIANLKAGVSAINLKPDLSDNSQWGRTGLAAPTGTGPYTFKATAAGAYLWAGNFAVAAGDTLTWDITVRGSGATLTDALGFNAGSQGWGDNTNVTATILSGQGTISMQNGNPVALSGLQTDADTRVRITRTFATAGSASAFFYLKGVGSAAVNDAVTLSAASIVLTPRYTNSSEALNRVSNSQFDGTAGWMTGYNPQNIVNGGSPSAGTTGGRAYIRTGFTATASGQVASISTDANNWFPVAAGERLAASAGFEATGAVSALTFVFNWRDANGNSLPTTTIGQISGAAAFNTRISGFATVPVGAISARLEVYMTSSAAGTGSFSMIEPMVSTASAAQADQPPFLPTPIADPVHDKTSRIFYDKTGRVVGTLDGEGYLSTVTYDAGGFKVAETAYANKPANGATAPFATLALGTSSADRTTHYVYDNNGQLRYVVDAQNHVTEYFYSSGADVIDGKATKTTTYDGVITPPSVWTVANMQTAITNAGIASSSTNRVSQAVYDADENLIYAIDPANGFTAFTYDTMGHVTKTVRYATAWDGSTPATFASAHAADANNRVTRSFYDARGDLTFTIDGEGYVTRYDYDAEDRQVGTVRWDNPVSLASVSDTTLVTDIPALVSGTYAATATSYDMDGRVWTTTDGEGYVTRYLYNANGTLATVQKAYNTPDQADTAYGYDAAGRVTSRTDANGAPEQQTTTFSYDAFGNKLSETYATGASTSWTYDRAGNVLTETDALTNVTHYDYNAFGELVKTTDPLGGITYSYYDTLGRVTLVRDAENYGTKYDYTVFGDLQAATRYGARTGDAGSTTTLPTFAPDAADAVTQFTYDKLGRLKRTTDALNNWEENSYNAFGQVAQNQGKLGLITTYSYDRRGLLSTIVVNAPVFNSAGTQVAASYTSHSYGYDARGNMVSDTEAPGLAETRVTTYVYDKLDRVLEKHLPQVQNTTNTGLVSPVEYYKYDGRGNVIEVKDAAGARTLNYYDDLDRVTVQIAPLGGYSTFAYTIVAGTGSTVVAKSYDAALGSLPANPGGTPPAAPAGTFRQTTSNYNKLGQLGSTVVTGVMTGKLVGSTYTTNASTTFTTAYSYDANGNVVTSTDPNGGVIYSYYDKLGRKTAQVDAGRYLTSWTLDTNGNVLGETRYANKVASSVTAATLASATAAGLPSLLGTGAVDADRATNFSYDKMGRRWTETRTGLTYWTINPTATTGALTLVTNGSSTVTYTYNALGEVLSKTEAAANTGSSAHDATNYTYDAAGRLTHTAGASFTDYAGNTVQGGLDYSYDALGNVVRTVQNSARVTTYAYGAGGRLQSMTDPTGAASTHTYFYDLAGRKIGDAYDRAKSNGTILHEGISYQYDLNGNLTRQAFATVSGGVFSDAGDVTTIAYNAHGEATSRSLNGVVQDQYRYDNAGRLEATNASNGVWRYFLYDANGNQTAEIDDEGKAGVNLVNQTLTNVLSIVTANGSAAIGGSYIDGVNATLTSYDARNQALSTVQTKRQLTTTGTPTDLTTSLAYNAFGEVATQTDALNYTTIYAYNTMGRTLSVKHPTTTVTGANGVDNTSATPTEYYYYDASGRLIGQMDANGNVVTRALLAGTGYGQSDALVVNEYHPDGGVVKNGYDVFGDLRKVTDEISRVTNNTYDAMGRLTQVSHYGGLVDTYAYDALGQRIKHSNNQLKLSDNTTPDTETTDYDVQGRVVSERVFGGDVTSTTYSWNANGVTTGLGTFGTYTQLTTYQNGRHTTDVSDAFGHLVSHTDMGNNNGRTNNISYDSAGRLVSRSLDKTVYTYLNTGLVGTVVVGQTDLGNQTEYDDLRTTYGYDKRGSKLTEVAIRETGKWNTYSDETGSYSEFDQSSWTTENATATYDALGRMTAWAESGAAAAGTGSSVTPSASITRSFDAVGNIRHLTATFHYLDTQGAVTSYTGGQDSWYRYDSMNRILTSKGQLSGGQIVRGATGVDLTYDLAGQRTSATRTTTETATIWDPNAYDPNAYGGWGGNTGNWVSQDYTADHREEYNYDAAGNLFTVKVADGSYTDNGDGTVTPTAPPATAALKGAYQYDLMGRLTIQIEYLGDGSAYAGPSYNYFYNVPTSAIANYRAITYDNGGRLTNETDIYHQGSDIIQTDTTNQFGSGSAYALGAVTSSTTNTYKNSTFQATQQTATTYDWYDGAVQTQVDVTPDSYHTPGTTFHTYYSYSPTGVFTSAHVVDGRERWVTVTNDAMGQAVRRDEADLNYDPTTGGDPHELWYRFDGRQVGYVGNNGTDDVDYGASLARRTAPASSGTTGAFRGGANYGSSYADFDLNYAPVNSYEQGDNAGTYTVKAGDTLAGIAAQLWGDPNLWYKIAEANGLSGDSQLAAGQVLRVPGGITNVHNSASTFKPYDPSDAFGETSPTTPKPQAAPKKGNKCGTFGVILLAVIAIAVTTIATAGAASLISAQPFSAVLGAMTGGTAVAGVSTAAWVAGGAIGGAIGSIASQGVGVATGIQDKFSWKGVALSALSGAVSAGIGSGGLFGSKGLAGSIGVSSRVVQAAVNGAVGSALTQGIAVATGLQPKFDWAGVAAAGIGAAGSSSIHVGGFGGKVLSNSAGGIANAAARSVIDGTDFGDNLIAALPDVIGQTVGSLVVGVVAGSGQDVALRRAGVNRSADAFEDQFGDTEEVAAYRKAGLAAAKNPDSDKARANFDRAARAMLDANSDDPGVADFLNHLNSNGTAVTLGDLTVTGNRNYLFGSTIDNAGIWVGETGDKIKQSVGRFVADHPGVGIALTLADGAFAVAAPGKYLAGKALDYFKDEASGYIADKMTGDNLWSVEKGKAGGDGFVLAGSLALGGLSALTGGVAALGGLRKVVKGALPRGFASLEDFTRFGGKLHGGLAQAGYRDTQAILQGSAVTGKSFKTGAPFDEGRVSDFDIALTGDSIFNAAKGAGIPLRSMGTRTGPLSERALKQLGLLDLAAQMSKSAGRPVNFMIYQTAKDAAKRAPSILLPK